MGSDSGGNAPGPVIGLLPESGQKRMKMRIPAFSLHHPLHQNRHRVDIAPEAGLLMASSVENLGHACPEL